MKLNNLEVPPKRILSFNKLYGDFNGDKIIPQDEAIHNPKKGRKMVVSIDTDVTIEEEVEIAAQIEL